MPGDPGRTRTPNILLRRQVLYPVELRDRLDALFTLHMRQDQSKFAANGSSGYPTPAR